MKKYLEIAKFTKTQGLKGEIRAVTYCDEPEELGEFDTLYLGKEKTPVVIQSVRIQKNIAILKLAGYDDVERAQGLVGRLLYIDRGDVSLEEDTWFVQDVIGLTVLDADDGRVYGVVDDVLQNAPVDVYSLKSPEGRQLMFPSVPEVLIDVDIGAGEIKIRPLDGLFDE